MAGASLFGKLRGRVKPGSVLANVTTLVSGTVITQIVTIPLSIVLARLYTPYDYGLFAIFSSLVAAVVTVAALRYDMTIVLPKSDAVALVVRRLAQRTIIVVSGVTLIGCLVAFRWAEAAWGFVLACWLPVSGLMVYLTADSSGLQYWLNRKTRYKAIARNRIILGIGTALLQLACAFVIGGVGGLIVGAVVAQAVALGILYWTTRMDLLGPLPPDAPRFLDVAKRYKKMPLVNGPNALVDAVRTNGINFLIAGIALDGLGQFNMAWRLMYAPVGLIQGAIGQVFYQKMATIAPGTMFRLVSRTLARMALAGVIVFGILFLLTPWLFPFLLGEQWTQAGLLAQALVPWLCLTLLTSPVSVLFVVTEHQPTLLVFSVVYCLATLTVLIVSPWPLLPTVWLLSGVTAAMLAVMLVLALREARHYDRPAGMTSAQSQ